MEEVTSGLSVFLRLIGITKGFPGVVANQDVSLTVKKGEIHAIVGENCAGKSTLLNMLYGLSRPDAGKIYFKGHDITSQLTSPADAMKLGIGLVSQHFSLIPSFTIQENIMLSGESKGFLDFGQSNSRLTELCNLLQLADIDFSARVDSLSVSTQQKVEILKALCRDATLLLLDEPTASLSPDESDALYGLIHQLRDEGKTILFVTHSISEATLLADRVLVMSPRPGRIVEIVDVALPRPRDFDMQGHPAFQSCAQRVRGRIFGGQSRSAA